MKKICLLIGILISVKSFSQVGVLGSDQVRDIQLIPGWGGGGSPASPIGSVQFNNTSGFGGDANLFWDNSQKFLGIGTSSPGSLLDVNGLGSFGSITCSGAIGSYAGITGYYFNGNAISNGGSYRIFGEKVINGESYNGTGHILIGCDSCNVKSDSLGIGIFGNPTARLDIYGTYHQTDTNRSTTDYNTRQSITFIDAVTNSATIIGSSNSMGIMSTNTSDYSGTIIGTTNEVGHAGTGTVASIFGQFGNITNNNTGTISQAVSNYGGIVNTAAGIITTAIGTAGQISNAGLGTITTAVTLFAMAPDNSGGGTMNYLFGLDIKDHSSIGTVRSWNILSEGTTSINAFEGDIIMLTPGKGIIIKDDSDGNCYRIHTIMGIITGTQVTCP